MERNVHGKVDFEETSKKGEVVLADKRLQQRKGGWLLTKTTIRCKLLTTGVDLMGPKVTQGEIAKGEERLTRSKRKKKSFSTKPSGS